MVVGICRSFRDRALDRCFHCFPCLSDPVRRSSLGLKVALVTLHLIYAGILFLFDSDLIEKTKKEPWYTALYLLLFFATLVQYFITSGSSPGYVLDAMRSVNERNVIYTKSSSASKQPASRNNGRLIVTVEGSQSNRNFQGSNQASWTKLVMDMYPPGTSIRTCTCSYCDVEQPPRAKHCHDCDKCVLQFDHHCVWLGTCIGQGNHCKFWWYICEETALCLWTGILYIAYLKANISRAWWKDAIMILLLIPLTISIIFLLLLLLFHSYLVLTNQTTYELVRRRRIPYLRSKDYHDFILMECISLVTCWYEVRVKHWSETIRRVNLCYESRLTTCSSAQIDCFWGFLSEYILLVKEFAATYTTSVVFGAAYTVWNLCPQPKNLKKSQGPTLA